MVVLWCRSRVVGESIGSDPFGRGRRSRTRHISCQTRPMDVSAAILIRSSWVVIEERWPTKSFLRQSVEIEQLILAASLEPRPLRQRSTPASPSGEEWDNFWRSWRATNLCPIFFLCVSYLSTENLNQREVRKPKSVYIFQFSSFFGLQKALRKPLTTSGWTRPEIPSGKG
uniref:Uncharacterized protein n=1 Tax=Heterorhabditis bacteriophora TaxID=37862 RepID=A0A1I7W9V1_HETBA